MNVQNGVLKSLSFLFEYIGYVVEFLYRLFMTVNSEMGKDYIYAVTPLLADALMDRDAVHRQTASTAVKHMALGVYGFGNEDALVHLLNMVWPNIYEVSVFITYMMRLLMHCHVDLTARDQCCHGRDFRDPCVLGIIVSAVLLPARPLSPSPQSPRGLLEGLQLHVHWRSGELLNHNQTEYE